MKSLIFAIGLFMASATAWANPIPNYDLSFAGGKYHAYIYWTDGPNLRTQSSFQVRWLDEKFEAIEAPGQFEIELSMPAHGHPGSPVSITGTEFLGVYNVTDVYFSMSGDWQVLVNVLFENNEQVEEQTFNLTLP